MILKKLHRSWLNDKFYKQILVLTVVLLSFGSGSLTWTGFAAEKAEGVEITVIPGRVYIEKGKGTWNLNFDFNLRNHTNKKLMLAKIKVEVFDRKDLLVTQRYISINGLPSAMETLNGKELEPGGTLYLFNPFFYFDEEIELHRLEYTFTIGQPGNYRMYNPTITVRPLVYPQKTPLFLLLKGRVMVEDGHDFYAHHRRLSLAHPIVKKLGIKSNTGRYAVDFCAADEKGKLYRSQGDRLEEWYGWGAPVYAPGSGKIVGIVSDFPDNTFDEKGKPVQSKRVSLDNPLSFFGNFVTIDHGNGEFSMLCHFKQDTLKVRRGQQVKAGDLLGEMGLSGSTFFPHIHYQLQDSAGINGEGLPAYFRSFRRWLGARSMVIEKGALDSGDIVEGITRK